MSEKKFPEVIGGYPFPAQELETLEEWKRLGIFERSLEKNRGHGRDYVFYEGPPTANNVPHVGHVPSRVVKDLLPRFQTMRGRHVARKAGWDTHGLPVEIEVEKKLGFSGKEEIEEYGIERFNRACLESVHTYERQWRFMTERIGYWVDLDNAYFTYTNRYVESVWWALSRLWRDGLLAEDYKIQPYCARCGTTLSSHEVAQNYQDADDPSLWALFPALPGQPLETVDGEPWTVPEGLSLVAWTTTPWTLTAHVGLAVSPDLVYRVVTHPSGELLLFAEELDNPVPCEITVDGKRRRLDLRELDPVVRIRGEALAGLRYERPYRTEDPERPAGGDDPPSDERGWPVFTADYVTASEGTGLVHTAPPFGEDDYKSGLKHGLPFFLTVDGEGRIVDKPGIEPFAGAGFKQVDPQVVRDLKERGRLLHIDRFRHNYPFCWRCNEPLLYYATRSWFVRTTERQDEIIRSNRDEVVWHPDHVGAGRFGRWLENMVDWALSRKRYWGTPLPIWRCDGCDHTEVVGSYTELFERAGRQLPEDPYDPEQFDPHRPFVDRAAPDEPFVWPCPECGDGTVGRVDDVIDAWFDSGSMPFAQHHYPFENREMVEGREQFPADLISEGVDQTRGWFYTLHVLGVLLFGSAAYRHCIVIGHVNDEQGRKMSKSLGNVVEPMQVVEQTGADALRWYFYVNNPELTSRFSARLVKEAAQSFLLPLWHALSFFTIYANLDGWKPGGRTVAFDSRPPMDRWILLRLNRLIAAVTENLDAYHITEAARAIEVFIDDLTNWYIRRTRSRFWAAANDDPVDKESAYQSLYEVLTTVAKLIAPFTPFLAEELHRRLIRGRIPGAEDSVHLESWPEMVEGRRDDELESAAATWQRIVRLGHAARNTHGLKTRQPLARVTLVTTDASLHDLVMAHPDVGMEELNVGAIDWAEDRSAYVHHEVRPVFPRLGPRFGKRMPAIKRALEQADGNALAESLDATDKLALEVEGETIELTAEEVEVRLVEHEETATAGDRDLLLVLDTHLTPDLVALGRAREVVHRLQSARKHLRLDYADRIRVRYRADPELEKAINRHREWISGETLAIELVAGEFADEPLAASPVDDLDFALQVQKVT
jgi:isoleucyl-tRNA synthetase